MLTTAQPIAKTATKKEELTVIVQTIIASLHKKIFRFEQKDRLSGLGD
ncbi:hypothetical protein [Acetobacter indonesiensis]